MKIEKGIPIPPHKGAGRPRTYSFELMKVGDSTLLDVTASSLYGTLARFKKLDKKYGSWEFKIVKLGDKQARVWRVK